MKKKELLKRLAAISMSAMMTVTMVPSNAFAADEIFSDTVAETSAEAEDISAADANDEEDTSAIDIEAEEPDATDVELEADEVESSDEADIFSDEQNASEGVVPEAGETDLTAEDGVEQKQYLKSLRLGLYTFEMENILVNDTFEYTYDLSYLYNKITLGAELSEDAPENSTITAKYYNCLTGKEITRNIISSDSGGSSLARIAEKDMNPVSFTVTVGTETDNQVYTITLNRPIEFDVVSVKKADGTSLTEVGGNYYVPANEECKSVQVTVQGGGVELAVNGTKVENNTPYELPVVFDEKTNTFNMTVTASYGEKTVTKVYPIHKYSDTDSRFNGTLNENISWVLEDGTLTISGIGDIPDWSASLNVTQRPSWQLFADKIKAVVIGEGITGIGENTFYGCENLEKAVLPSTLKKISARYFEKNTKLTEVQINDDRYVVDGKFVYTKDKKTLVWCLPGYGGKLEIPSGITDIAAEAFYYNNIITEVALPDTLETIGEDAFYYCNKLTSVSMGDKVTSIGARAFSSCYSLVDVKLSAGLTSISESMFEHCSSLKSIVIPDKVTEIGRTAFEKCKALESISLPESLTTLNYGIFLECQSLKNITLPSKVTSMPGMLFGFCSSLESIKVPVSVTSMGNGSCSGATNLKYIFYEGTPQQWDAIIPADAWSKPEQPNTSAVILYGCTSVDNNKDLPKIAEQPQNKIIKDGDELTALQIKAEALQETGSRYYFDWYKKVPNRKTVRVSSTASEDGLGSSCMPAEATNDSVEYFCMVEKVDADGVASWTYSDSASVTLGLTEFAGHGLPGDPYLITGAEDLMTLHKMVNEDGKSMTGICFKFTADITLPDGWTPMGCTVDGSTNISLNNLHAFGGSIDGDNKTLTVPEGGKPLLGYIKGAEVKNLNIFGTKIDGYGLVNNCEGVGLGGSAIVIDNVTLKSGSSTLKSGLIGANITTNSFAGCSADFITTIRNCTIEEGVVVGYNKDQRIIGSIAGRLQGTIENCVSHATVYGTEYVGGIAGSRDNAMGECTVKNCTFDGTVEASGAHAGGIVGGGYENMSAPNGRLVTINGCTASGTVAGEDKVGGILGGDTFVAQAWDNCAYTMKGNSFTGKVKVTGENASYIGGIIGFYDSLNKMDDISNNYYAKDCGAAKGIGFVQYVDTNCTTHETESGAVYLNSENGTKDFPNVPGCGWKPGYNRTDDPLGADADKLTNTEGVKLYVEKLELSGDYRTVFYLGEELDLTGMVIKANMSDGTTRDVAVSDLTVEGYNKEKRGNQSLTVSYEGASVQVPVKVLKKDPEDIKVSFEVLGDSVHGDQVENVHTLRAGNLETWIKNEEYEVGGNATVLDVMEKVLTENEYKWYNKGGNYIASITKPDGTELSELTNGQNSGWMYTLNGIHSDLGVSEQYLEDGDIIVFHYTDDYNLEHDHIWGSSWSTDENAHWHECTYEFNDCDITDNTQKAGYGEHTFDEGKVTTEATCTEAGVKTYTCTVCGYEKTEEIPAAGHKFSSWKTVSKATVFAPKKEERKCSVCGKKETRNSGSKLKATIKLNVTSITLQKKQSTKAVKVTMANGDSVKSWTVGNKKIATVSKSGVIKAGTKTGATKVTVTLKSGKKAYLKVKVQAGKVKTTKISGLKSKVTLKKGQKLALKPVLSPVTSQDKVTYVSSNKKVATVSKNGTVVVKKKGTAKITVKSGTKKYTIKVTVK